MQASHSVDPKHQGLARLEGEEGSTMPGQSARAVAEVEDQKTGCREMRREGGM